jgi:hypothetical protein
MLCFEIFPLRVGSVTSHLLLDPCLRRQRGGRCVKMQARRFGSQLQPPTLMSPKPDAGRSLDHTSTVQDRDHDQQVEDDPLRSPWIRYSCTSTPKGAAAGRPSQRPSESLGRMPVSARPEASGDGRRRYFRLTSPPKMPKAREGAHVWTRASSAP